MLLFLFLVHMKKKVKGKIFILYALLLYPYSFPLLLVKCRPTLATIMTVIDLMTIRSFL